MKKHRGHAIAIKEKASYSERITSWLTAHVNKKDLFHTYPPCRKAYGNDESRLPVRCAHPGLHLAHGPQRNGQLLLPKGSGSFLLVAP